MAYLDNAIIIIIISLCKFSYIGLFELVFGCVGRLLWCQKSFHGSVHLGRNERIVIVTLCYSRIWDICSAVAHVSIGSIFYYRFLSGIDLYALLNGILDELYFTWNSMQIGNNASAPVYERYLFDKR